ncbi:hypothetical protein, partial [Rhodopirellula europaea]|uniref:hypothetical protein n=1 Tax=Rhodopirellula europaea TaxID=1263866 RepID=UPI0005878807
SGENLGLRSITNRYLQLSSASSSSLTAEVNRVGAAAELRDWILHSVCGTELGSQTTRSRGV